MIVETILFTQLLINIIIFLMIIDVSPNIFIIIEMVVYFIISIIAFRYMIGEMMIFQIVFNTLSVYLHMKYLCMNQFVLGRPNLMG